MSQIHENQKLWSQVFIAACQKGIIEHVKDLCQKKYLKNQWANVHDFNESGFREACMNGHLEVVKYLLTSPELIDAGHTFVNLHAQSEDGFRRACQNGHLEVVKYLLTSPELIGAGHTFANLHMNQEEGFRWACNHGHLNVVKYLLTSPELKAAGHAFADVHADDDSGLLLASVQNQQQVVRWLILDYGITKTPTIERMLNISPEMKEYFRVRDEIQEIGRSMHLKSLQDHDKSSSKLDLKDERAAKKAKKL